MRQPIPTIPALLSAARQSHQSGRLVEARALYEQLLRRDSKNHEALNQLGFVIAAQGQVEQGIQLIRRALALFPKSSEALNNLGHLQLGARQTAAALASFDRAIAINPNFAQAFNNRGIALRRMSKDQEAVASYEKAIALRPDYAEAWNNRGNALHGLGRDDDAVLSYDKAIGLRPDYVEALSNRGMLLLTLGRNQEALASLGRVLALRPDSADALNLCGTVLLSLSRYEEALARFDAAIARKPDFGAAFSNRGIALQILNRADEAVASHDKALTLQPDSAEALLERCMAELPILYQSQSEILTRRQNYEMRLKSLSEEVDRKGSFLDMANAIAGPRPFFNALPFYLAYQGQNDRDLQALYGSFLCRIMAQRVPQSVPTPPATTGEKVRVGIVSGFFRSHSNWKMPIRGWLSQLDRERFELFGYHTGSLHDDVTTAAAALCSRFVQGPLSLERWVTEITADAPHVLIYPEIGMSKATAMLAALRLAPVQCNSWGHPNTSGFPTVDYYLSSDLMEPSEGQEHYTERLVRLPNLSVFYEPPNVLATQVAREDVGLRSTATVYWCCQALYKYLPQFDEVFPRIARAAGDCQFVFLELQDEYRPLNQLFRQRLDKAFVAEGLASADYCVFLRHLGRHEFVATAGLCDVFLDSIGWSGCNSALESLTHDLPIVTLAGPLMRGRHSLAILRMMGVTETIATTVDEYVSLAVRLARDLAWRDLVKQRIAENKSRLYRDQTCISAFEDFLDEVAHHPPPSKGSPSAG